MEIARLLRDFQAEWESPAFGLFRGAPFSTALLPTNCAKDPNNNAEHAVKPFAALRQIIGGITTEKGVRDYLVLLSLCETCKYMGVGFLDFLRSGEKDIRTFAESRRGRKLGRARSFAVRSTQTD